MSGSKRSLWKAAGRAQLTRVLVVYLGGSYAVLEIVDIFTDQFGLPDWFFPGVVVLLLVGLPIVVATALLQSRRAQQREAGVEKAVSVDEPAPVGAGEPARWQPGEPRTHPVSVTPGPWLTWRKAIMGLVAAFALWGIVVAAYMGMRMLGIGPIGSLVAAGVLDERERIILADFENKTGDPLLAQAATEAFRIDFSQSPIVTVVQTATIRQVLARMQRSPEQPLDLDLAREVAIREGIKVVVSGDITPVGSGFVLAAQLIAPQDGKVLAAYRETAGDSTAIIGAIDELSKKLRERIGESLKTIRGNEPLDRVTTASLEALRKYSQAVRATELGDPERGIALLEEAIALDTAFAMAHRKLGVTLGNIGRDPARRIEALTAAFAHSDRLTDRERYLTLGSYHSFVTGEDEKAIAAYQSLLDVYPDDVWALNNLAVLYVNVRDYERAEQLLDRAVALDSAGALYYGNLITAQVGQGEFDVAQATLERFLEQAPEHPNAALVALSLASARFDYTSAERLTQAFREAQRASEFWQLATALGLAQIDEVQGRLAAAEGHVETAMALAEAQGQPGLYLGSAVRIAIYDGVLRGEPAAAVRRVEAALARHPLPSIEPLERPYVPLALFYALTEMPDRARAMLAQYDEIVAPHIKTSNDVEPGIALAAVALAEGRAEDAIADLRRADRGNCSICILPLLGQAYDAAGQPDSVIAVYERYVNTPWLPRLAVSDWYALAGIYERLGGLYDLRGDKERAISYYQRFVKLWEDADPELQPRVLAARRAIERLSAES